MSTNSVRNLIEALRRTRDARLFQSTFGKQFQIDLPDLQFESVVRPIQPQAVNQHRAGESTNRLDLNTQSERQPWIA